MMKYAFISLRILFLTQVVQGWIEISLNNKSEQYLWMRVFHNTVLLDDGQVLVLGGMPAAAAADYSTREMLKFNPETNLWTHTPDPTSSCHTTHTLLSSGEILFMGDRYSSSECQAGLFHPAKDEKSSRLSENLLRGRDTISALPLPDGNVLAIGKYKGIYWFDVNEMEYPKQEPYAFRCRERLQGLLLPNDQVFLTAVERHKDSELFIEIYDIKTNTTQSIATGMNLTLEVKNSGTAFSATLLKNGYVLLIAWRGEAKLFNPVTKRLGGSIHFPALGGGFTTNLLNDGKVLICGGLTKEVEFHHECYLFDPDFSVITQTGSMPVPRRRHATVVLHDGRVLFVGGGNDYGPIPQVDFYDPRTGNFSNPVLDKISVSELPWLFEEVEGDGNNNQTQSNYPNVCNSRKAKNGSECKVVRLANLFTLANNRRFRVPRLDGKPPIVIRKHDPSSSYKPSNRCFQIEKKPVPGVTVVDFYVVGDYTDYFTLEIDRDGHAKWSGRLPFEVSSCLNKYRPDCQVLDSEEDFYSRYKRMNREQVLSSYKCDITQEISVTYSPFIVGTISLEESLVYVGFCFFVCLFIYCFETQRRKFWKSKRTARNYSLQKSLLVMKTSNKQNDMDGYSYQSLDE